MRNPGPPVQLKQSRVTIPGSRTGLGRGWNGVVPKGTRVVDLAVQLREPRLDAPEFVLRLVDDKGESREIKSGLIERRPHWNCSREAGPSEAPIARADSIELTGKWHVSIQTREEPSDTVKSQYGHHIRITPEGTIYPSLRHELNGNVEWRESAEALGWIRQVSARKIGMKWKEYPDDYAIQSKDTNSFVVTRTWVLPGPTEKELYDAPMPRPPRGDRSFRETLTFKRK
jgi:hypothetical protein